MDSRDGFNDFLDVVTDEDTNDDLPSQQGTADVPKRVLEWSHGPLNWNTSRSLELQEVVDSFDLKDLVNIQLPLQMKLCDIKFSVNIADPNHSDFPIVACSSGFSELTGYLLPEIVGRNCRFLLDGVPPSSINQEARFHIRAFCNVVKNGWNYNSRSEVLPLGVRPCGESLAKGEILCVQTNARKNGDLFRNMFFLKQVMIDQQSYVVGLQTEIFEDCDEPAELQQLQEYCDFAWRRVLSGMEKLEHIFCA